MDGQWDSALDFVEPLSSYPEFNSRHFRYLILKHKYFELLCIKTEPGPMQNNEFTVDEIVECLHSLESVCPSPDEYRQLRALLTLPTLSEHDQFRHWNPSSARMECFNAVYPLVRDFLSISDVSGDHQRSLAAKNERLMQLVVKGMLYEACVDFCQNKALTMTAENGQPKQRHPSNMNVRLNKLLSDRGGQNDDGPLESTATDLSLVCWLESLPKDAFGVQFVQKTLDLKCEALRRPELEALWTEQILVTPIKPMMFPHAAVPMGRLKSAEKMSRSMIPQYDGLASGLGKSPCGAGGVWFGYGSVPPVLGSYPDPLSVRLLSFSFCTHLTTFRFALF